MATLVQENGVKSLSNAGMVHAGHQHQLEVTGGPPAPQGAVQGEEGAQGEDLAQQPQQEAEEEVPEIEIVINNVVCSFSVRCHLNLKQIALTGVNVEFRRENGMVTMKLRRPYTTASIWSSGRITCTGATSEEQARIAARRYARCLQRLGFKARFHNFRVVNVLGTCAMPFAIKITAFSQHHKEADYEPELHPGVTYKITNPKATLKIFSTGSVTVTARSVSDVQTAIERIFPLVYEFRKERTAEEEELFQARRSMAAGRRPSGAHATHPPHKRRRPQDPMDLVTLSDDEGDGSGSDQSWDI